MAMKLVTSAGWVFLLCLGLSVCKSPSAEASEVVSYTPGNSFNFNPVMGNPNESLGTVNVQSDSSTGWVLKVRSANQGAFKHLGSTYHIQYSLTVDGLSVDLSSGTDAIAKSVNTTTCADPGGCNFPLQGTVSATEIDGKPAGRYTDTLIFTLINQ
jgi:hypothetical protein